MRMLFPFVLMLAGCTTPNGRIDRAPERLLSEMKAACGGAAWDRVRSWHETSVAEIPGMGRFDNDVWHDMQALKSVMFSAANGRRMRAVGYNGEVAWQQGPDGQVRSSIDPARLRVQRRDAYLSSFGWFFPRRFPAEFAMKSDMTYRGKNYSVIQVSPRNAEPFDLWVDPATRQVGRIVAGDEYAELSDYRTFGGVCTATKGRQGGGDGKPELALRVIDVKTDQSAAPSLFDPPR